MQKPAAFALWLGTLIVCLAGTARAAGRHRADQRHSGSQDRQLAMANGNDLQAGFTLRPVARLKIDEIYYLTRLRTAQASVLVNHLTRTRINYQFTRELSLRMIMDYNAVLENAALIDLTRQKRITGDALLTYLIHPGTALYVGYTDQLGNLGLIDGVVRPIPFPSTTTARQFFAKISYLFRF
jgi:hypothetical protein